MRPPPQELLEELEAGLVCVGADVDADADAPDSELRALAESITLVGAAPRWAAGDRVPMTRRTTGGHGGANDFILSWISMGFQKINVQIDRICRIDGTCCHFHLIPVAVSARSVPEPPCHSISRAHGRARA